MNDSKNGFTGLIGPHHCAKLDELAREVVRHLGNTNGSAEIIIRVTTTLRNGTLATLVEGEAKVLTNEGTGDLVQKLLKEAREILGTNEEDGGGKA